MTNAIDFDDVDSYDTDLDDTPVRVDGGPANFRGAHPIRALIVNVREGRDTETTSARVVTYVLDEYGGLIARQDPAPEQNVVTAETSHVVFRLRQEIVRTSNQLEEVRTELEEMTTRYENAEAAVAEAKDSAASSREIGNHALEERNALQAQLREAALDRERAEKDLISYESRLSTMLNSVDPVISALKHTDGCTELVAAATRLRLMIDRQVGVFPDHRPFVERFREMGERAMVLPKVRDEIAAAYYNGALEAFKACGLRTVADRLRIACGYDPDVAPEEEEAE